MKAIKYNITTMKDNFVLNKVKGEKITRNKRILKRKQELAWPNADIFLTVRVEP